MNSLYPRPRSNAANLVNAELLNPPPPELVGPSKSRMLKLSTLPSCGVTALGVGCWGAGAGAGEGIVHRDIKAQNILRRADGSVLIADFGLAVEGSGSSDNRAGLAGTHCYMAPELLIEDKSKYASASDMWAFWVAK